MKTDKHLPTDTPATDILLNLKHKGDTLWQRYQALKADSAMLFPTEGALALGVSEFALLAASPSSRYLGSDCRAMLHALHRLGEVEHIVRNEFAVHEKQASFINLNISNVMGISMGEGAFDLRFFMHRWQHMLALDNGHLSRPSFCIAFFDEYGQAISKVFLKHTDAESIATWRTLVDEFTDTDIDSITLKAIAAQPNWQPKTLSAAAKADFERDWLAMSDIHQFHKVLDAYQLDRQSGFALAPAGCARRVPAALLEPLFHRLKAAQTPMMTFVGSTGIVQIHAGVPTHIKRLGDWLNILDKADDKFTLHLNDNAIHALWWVKRPNGDGHTIALEGFDIKGNSIVAFFGVREEGKAQDPSWQALIDELIDGYD